LAEAEALALAQSYVTVTELRKPCPTVKLIKTEVRVDFFLVWFSWQVANIFLQPSF